jgi:glycogen debranching enzyme
VSLAAGPLDELTCVSAESFVVSARTGDISSGTDQGFFVRDTRFLCRLEVRVEDHAPSPLNAGVTGPGHASFHGFVPRAPSRAADPTIHVLRRRIVHEGLRESVRVDNLGREPVTLRIEVLLASDLATVFAVKHGERRELVAAVRHDDGLRFTAGGQHVDIRPDPPAHIEGSTIRWQLDVPTGSHREVAMSIAATDRYGRAEAPPPQPRDGTTAPPPRPPALAATSLRCSETRLTRLLQRSQDDLASLVVPDPEDPRDRFCAAGSPWYLTLFGRDALWTAFATVPFDLELAAGTLRILARRQGRRHELDSEEAPGKILHEVRRGALTHEGAFPATYYGSIDATPLFVILLSEAWRWGLPEVQVEALLPNLEAALAWMGERSTEGDGLLAYRRPGARGLVNQGWKDSVDGIQHRDGTLAQPPIALSEVQAYAFEAAVRGAELLDRFDRPGAEAWRAWAERMRALVHGRFWLEDATGPYLAVALDGAGRPVDSVTSNMGHVLVTDLLSPEERDHVAARLVHPTMDSGWGLRTMASDSAGYNPLGYHTGSVWPHDTAIAVWGLARGGHHDAATALLRGLVRAAPHLRYRLPELLSGQPWSPGGYPVPYPVACRPQAWSAAAAALLVRACFGAEAHLPEGRLELAPLWPPPFRHLELVDFPLAGGHLDVVVDAHDGTRVDRRDTDLEITIQEGARSRP